MTSWRDTATAEAQGDLDGLLNVVLPFAEQMLQKHGEFYPFGASVSAAGKVAMLGGQPEDNDHPSSVSVLEIMLEGVRSSRDNLRAPRVRT